MSDFGFAGSAIGIKFENTYEYRGHAYDKFDTFVNELNFDLNMRKHVFEYTNKDVEATLELAVELAQEFVATSHPVNKYSAYQTTHDLEASIRYDTETSSGGPGGRLYAPAKDKRGHKYAGHIEYGFTDRLGIPHGPWPFLRPAMRLALAATRADFADSMISGMFYNQWQEGSRMSHGSKDAYANLTSVFGARAISSAVAHVKSEYQRIGADTGGKWHYAHNGIGFKSGVSTQWSMDANGYDWRSGSL